MKVLVADDDAVVRKFLERKLAQWNFEVVSVADGNKALKTLKLEDAPKLAVLDWMMPGMDGIEVCRLLRQTESPPPAYIILLTARDDKKDIIQGLDAGADDYITKPFDSDELHARIKVGRRMIELQTALAEKEKLQGVLEMAGAVCHEMNQPMQVVSGVSELLLMDQLDDDVIYGKIKTIKAHIDKMALTTRKLMRITSYRTKDHLKGKIIDIDKAIE
ncbi:MAG: response regulator transcription factor [Proteobacteria bacterium]|nr:response regulator transcription factor [Pseudomonadota bacterium]